jgi:hypothetical protein
LKRHISAGALNGRWWARNADSNGNLISLTDDLFLYHEARSIGVERIIGASNGATDTSLLDELGIDAGFQIEHGGAIFDSGPRTMRHDPLPLPQ